LRVPAFGAAGCVRFKSLASFILFMPRGSHVSKSQLRTMKNLDLYVTTSCNRIEAGSPCGDCMAYGRMKERGIAHMEYGLFTDVVDQVSGIGSVFFAGIGEPAYHPRFFDMLAYAAPRAREVRVNTNGDFLKPLLHPGSDRNELVAMLPQNLHVFFSADRYHKRDWKPADAMAVLKKKLPDAKVTYNVRVEVKSPSDDVAGRFGLGRKDEIIVNRVLGMGLAQGNVEHRRPLDLYKLVRDHRASPMFGVDYDGDVFSGFIAPYLPKANRPRFSVLGNAKDEPLYDIVMRYRRSLRGIDFDSEEPLLAEAIDGVGGYPFVIEQAHKFDWNAEELRPKREQIISNTAAEVAESVLGMREEVFEIDRHESDLVSEHGRATMPLKRSRAPALADLLWSCFRPGAKRGDEANMLMYLWVTTGEYEKVAAKAAEKSYQELVEKNGGVPPKPFDVGLERPFEILTGMFSEKASEKQALGREGLEKYVMEEARAFVENAWYENITDRFKHLMYIYAIPPPKTGRRRRKPIMLGEPRDAPQLEPLGSI